MGMSSTVLFCHLTFASLAAFASAQDQPAAVEPLTAAQLSARPDLWPSECTITRGFRIEANAIAKGSTVCVTRLEANKVTLDFPELKLFTVVDISATDVLQRVDADWQKFTPEQRALDAATLVGRADLWPDRVHLVNVFVWKHDGQAQVLPKGTELALGTFDGEFVRARLLAGDSLTFPRIEMTRVDFAAQARAALLDRQRPKSHRVLRELDGKLVSMKTGKQVNLSAAKPPEFVALYFSAGWCGPCREFSPKLVAFYEAHKRDVGKRFELIWVSWDHSEREMQQYARGEKFPWLAVSWSQLDHVPLTRSHDLCGIPDLMVLDGNGNVVVDSYKGEDFTGANAALAQFGELLKK